MQSLNLNYWLYGIIDWAKIVQLSHLEPKTQMSKTISVFYCRAVHSATIQKVICSTVLLKDLKMFLLLICASTRVLLGWFYHFSPKRFFLNIANFSHTGLLLWGKRFPNFFVIVLHLVFKKTRA